MAEYKKEHGFLYILKEGLSYISQVLSTIIFPQITEGAEVIMKNIDDKIRQIEKRILRNMSAFFIIGFGLIFLIFALFFFLIEYLGWNNSAAFFFIGIIIFVIGLLLKIGEYNRR